MQTLPQRPPSACPVFSWGSFSDGSVRRVTGFAESGSSFETLWFRHTIMTATCRWDLPSPLGKHPVALFERLILVESGSFGRCVEVLGEGSAACPTLPVDGKNARDLIN